MDTIRQGGVFVYSKDDKRPVESTDEFLEEFCNAYSTTDCTGLIPEGNPDEEEIENYNELYRYLP